MGSIGHLREKSKRNFPRQICRSPHFPLYKREQMFYDKAQENEVRSLRGRPSACSFTGHRPEKLPWKWNEDDSRCIALKKRLADAAEAAYQAGFRHFMTGMAQGCDLYACECALELRRRCPDVTVEAVIPCPTQADRWPAAQRERWQRLISACDYETLVSSHYTPDCMQRRNRYLVDHASLLIAMYDGTPGGTRYTVEYALRRGVEIVDISI